MQLPHRGNQNSEGNQYDEDSDDDPASAIPAPFRISIKVVFPAARLNKNSFRNEESYRPRVPNSGGFHCCRRVEAQLASLPKRANGAVLTDYYDLTTHASRS